MRHRNAGYKLGRNTSHRRAMLRNLVTSVILMDRVETTITKCKATRPPHREDDHARQARHRSRSPSGSCLSHDP